MTTITPEELCALLRDKVKGAQPISFTALTTLAKDRKNGVAYSIDDAGQIIPRKVVNPYYGITRKLTRVQAFTAASYEASVNRQRVREGVEPAFEAKARQWGERITPSLVRNVDETGKEVYYLIAQVLKAKEPIYLAPKNGLLQIIPKDLLAPFLPAQTPNVAQGVEHEVIYRNYSLENIVSLNAWGEVFRVRRHESLRA